MAATNKQYSYSSASAWIYGDNISASHSGNNVTITGVIRMYSGGSSEGSANKYVCCVVNGATYYNCGSWSGSISSGNTYSPWMSFAVTVGVGTTAAGSVSIGFYISNSPSGLSGSGQLVWNGRTSTSTSDCGLKTVAVGYPASSGGTPAPVTRTVCSPPTSVTVDTTYALRDGTVTISWSGAKAGTNNPIANFTLFCNDKMVGYYQDPTNSKHASEKYLRLAAGATSGSTTIKLDNSFTDNGTKHYLDQKTVEYKWKIRVNSTYTVTGQDAQKISTASATTKIYSKVSAPSSISVTPNTTNKVVAGNSNFTISWGAATAGTNNNISKYLINNVNVGTATSKTYSLAAGKSTKYAVVAQGERGDTSAEKSVTVYAVGLPSTKPSFTSITFNGSQFTLKWNVPTITAVDAIKSKLTIKYKIEYKIENGDWISGISNLTTNTVSNAFSAVSFGSNVSFRLTYLLYDGSSLVTSSVGNTSAAYLKGKLPNKITSLKLTDKNFWNKCSHDNYSTYTTNRTQIIYTTSSGASNSNFRLNNNIDIQVVFPAASDNSVTGRRLDVEFYCSKLNKVIGKKTININGSSAGTVTENLNFTHSSDYFGQTITVRGKNYNIYNNNTIGDSNYSFSFSVIYNGKTSLLYDTLKYKVQSGPEINWNDPTIKLHYNQDNPRSFGDYYLYISGFKINNTDAIYTTTPTFDFCDIGFAIDRKYDNQDWITLSNTNSSFDYGFLYNESFVNFNYKYPEGTTIARLIDPYNQNVSISNKNLNNVILRLNLYDNDLYDTSYLNLKTFNGTKKVYFRIRAFNRFKHEVLLDKVLQITLDGRDDIKNQVARLQPSFQGNSIPEKFFSSIGGVSNIYITPFHNGTDTYQSCIIFKFYPLYDPNNAYDSSGNANYVNINSVNYLLEDQADSLTYYINQFYYTGSTWQAKEESTRITVTPNGYSGNRLYKGSENISGNNVVYYIYAMPINLVNSNSGEVLAVSVTATNTAVNKILNNNPPTATNYNFIKRTTSNTHNDFEIFLLQPCTTQNLTLVEANRITNDSSNSATILDTTNYRAIILDPGASWTKQLISNGMTTVNANYFDGTITYNLSGLDVTEGGSYSNILQNETLTGSSLFDFTQNTTKVNELNITIDGTAINHPTYTVGDTIPPINPSKTYYTTSTLSISGVNYTLLTPNVTGQDLFTSATTYGGDSIKYYTSDSAGNFILVNIDQESYKYASGNGIFESADAFNAFDGDKYTRNTIDIFDINSATENAMKLLQLNKSHSYSFKLDSTLTVNIYPAYLQDESIPVYSTSICDLSFTSTFVLPSEVATMSLRKNKLGVNREDLYKTNAALVVKDKNRLDVRNWDTEDGVASSSNNLEYYPNTVEIIGDKYNKMPEYRYTPFTYGADVTTNNGTYIGFYGETETEHNWFGSIGYDNNYQPYALTGTPGNRIKFALNPATYLITNATIGGRSSGNYSITRSGEYINVLKNGSRIDPSTDENKKDIIKGLCDSLPAYSTTLINWIGNQSGSNYTDGYRFGNVGACMPYLYGTLQITKSAGSVTFLEYFEYSSLTSSTAALALTWQSKYITTNNAGWSGWECVSKVAHNIGVTSVAANTDLNTLTTSNTYYGDGSIGASLVNAPYNPNKGFKLTVDQNNKTSNYRTQTIRYYDGETWMRVIQINTNPITVTTGWHPIEGKNELVNGSTNFSTYLDTTKVTRGTNFTAMISRSAGVVNLSMHIAAATSMAGGGSTYTTTTISNNVLPVGWRPRSITIFNIPYSPITAQLRIASDGTISIRHAATITADMQFYLQATYPAWS